MAAERTTGRKKAATPAVPEGRSEKQHEMVTDLNRAMKQAEEDEAKAGSAS